MIIHTALLLLFLTPFHPLSVKVESFFKDVHSIVLDDYHPLYALQVVPEEVILDVFDFSVVLFLFFVMVVGVKSLNQQQLHLLVSLDLKDVPKLEFPFVSSYFQNDVEHHVLQNVVAFESLASSFKLLYSLGFQMVDAYEAVNNNGMLSVEKFVHLSAQMVVGILVVVFNKGVERLLV